MIQDYVTTLASQMGIQLSKVSIIESKPAGCTDVYLLHLSTKGHTVNALVLQSDIDMLRECGNCCDRLEVKIRSTLLRLKVISDL